MLGNPLIAALIGVIDCHFGKQLCWKFHVSGSDLIKCIVSGLLNRPPLSRFQRGDDGVEVVDESDD